VGGLFRLVEWLPGIADVVAVVATVAAVPAVAAVDFFYVHI
jgi:hypothetical protein